MDSATTHIGHLMRTLQHWMAQAQLASPPEAVTGIVVILGSSRLRVTNLPMPVGDGPSALADWQAETDPQRACCPPAWLRNACNACKSGSKPQ